MKKKYTKGVFVIGILLFCSYSALVILNPSVPSSRRTLYIKENLDPLIDIFGMRWNKTHNQSVKILPPFQREESALHSTFNQSVYKIGILVKKAMLDEEPSRIRLKVRLKSKKDLFGRIKVVKILDPRGGANATIEKAYKFPRNEKTSFSLHVWKIKEKRINAHLIRGDLITITDIKEKNEEMVNTYQNILESITLYNLRIVRYNEGEGRKKKTPTFSIETVQRKVLLFFPPYMLAVIVPYFFWERHINEKLEKEGQIQK